MTAHGARSVVVVFSFRHSGSTLLGDLLGAAPGAVFVGESDRVWDGVARGRPCSCGVALSDCDVQALRSITPSPTPPGAVFDLLRSPRRLVGLCRGAVRLPPDWEVRAEEQRLYWDRRGAVGEVVIDTSKTLALVAHQAASMDEPDVNVVLLRRDVRDVVSSSLRRADFKALRGRGRLRLLVSGLAESLRWLLTNELGFRCLRRASATLVCVDYEDLVDRPELELQRLTEALGLDPVPLSGRSVEGPDRHVVWANRNREGASVTVQPRMADRRSLGTTLALFLPIVGVVDRFLGARRMRHLSINSSGPRAPRRARR